jgi:cysteine-rich secretory family protein
VPRRRILQSNLSRTIRVSIAVIACALTTTGVLVATTSPAHASSAGAFVADTNSARASAGLSGLSVSGDLTSVAQQHAAAMARNQSLYHNSSLGSDVCCWSSIGENIGEGQSESQVQNAFMNSTPHRDNILSSAYTQIGVGTATDSHGTLWVDEVFRQPMGSSGSHHISTTHSTTRHTTRSYTYSPPSSVHRAALPRRINIVAVLIHRLRDAAMRRGHPHDPVAAAVGFTRVMALLQH